MPAVSAYAPGKVILFGEHAVVYGQPAIAVPVTQVHARVMISAEPRQPKGTLRIQAPDIGLDSDLSELPASHPLAATIRSVMEAVHISHPPALSIRVTSTIPVASGLGSGAAVSVALIRALAGFLGQPLPDAQVSALAFEVEKLHHGTPSGIDNTVITYARPVYFVREKAPETFHVAAPFVIVIGDTGIYSPTSQAVGDVRRAWQADTAAYEQIFEQIGRLAITARSLIESGQPDDLGPIMDANHSLLVQMGVSSVALDRLVTAARRAGAKGAKLSGGGRGGNMIALTETEQAGVVSTALLDAGAVRTLTTTIQ